MTWNLTDGSLCQLNGVSRETERHFRSVGIVDAEALLHHLTVHGQVSLLRRVRRNAEIYRQARRLGLTDIIVNMFPVGTRTRIISDRYEKTLFFDVETDSAGVHADITLISTIMNGVERTFVRGVDLHEFLEPWKEAEVIVSFNGKRFDVPVLMREFGLSRIPAHVDLMDEGRHYGLRGGLKTIEGRICFQRAALCCRNGLDAVEMWHSYCQDGDEDKLEALKTYNLEDVRSLVALYRYLLPLSTEGVFAL